MTATSTAPWPGVLAQIQEATDAETAMRIANAFGGTVVWIPQGNGADTQLARLVGVDAAVRIAQAVGAGAVRVPAASAVKAAERRQRVMQLRQEGQSLRQIALQTGLSTERVRQILRGT